jgi:hypothetical protein
MAHATTSVKIEADDPADADRAAAGRAHRHRVGADAAGQDADDGKRNREVLESAHAARKLLRSIPWSGGLSRPHDVGLPCKLPSSSVSQSSDAMMDSSLMAGCLG